MSNYKETVVDDREIELSSYKESLDSNNEVTELNNYQEGLDLNSNDHSGIVGELPDTLDFLIDDGENQLTDYKENLNLESGGNSGQVEELSDYKETIIDDRESELSNYREDIVDDRNIKLSDYRENIKDDREPSLSDFIDELVDDRENQLTNYKETIEDSRENKLSDYKKNLEVSNDPELNDYREDIIDDRKNELSNHQEKLDVEGSNHSGLVEDLEDHQERLDLSGENSGIITDLSDTLLTITDDRENTLPNYIESITDDREPSLEDYREDLKDDRENKLSDFREDITDDRENKLEDFKDELTDNRDNSLEDYKEELVDDRNTELEDFKDKLTDDRETSLGDFIDKLEDDRENQLKDVKIERPEASSDNDKYSYNPNQSLEDEVIKLKSGSFKEVNQLDKTLDDINKDFSEGVSINTPEAISENKDYNYFDPNAEGNQLYDAVLERPNAEGNGRDSYNYFDPEVEGNELYDAVLGRPEVIGDKASKFEKKLGLEETADLAQFLKSLKGENEQDFYNNLIKLLDNYGDWGKKIQSLMSSYLSSSKITPERAEEYKSKLDQEYSLLQAIENKLPESINDNSDVSSLINKKQTLPNELKNLNIPFSIKKDNRIPNYQSPSFSALNLPGISRNSLLTETFQMVSMVSSVFTGKNDVYTNSILPGTGIIDQLKSEITSLYDAGTDTAINEAIANNDLAGKVFGNLAGGMVEGFKRSNPINVPEIDILGLHLPVKGWDGANSRTTTSGNSNLASGDTAQSDKKQFWKNVSSTLVDMGLGSIAGAGKYSFALNYLTGAGINLTLSELCKNTEVSSVDDLFNALRTSPFITVPDKFTTTGNNGYVVQTLDTNAYWEIIFEPYVGADNGNYSYLPALHEINTRNIAIHGVNTSYNKWIPFVSFDLQKSRMQSKNIDLYDGSISYPVSMEYINELRLIIADDQYKSWRTYFETCADAAIYNSEPHQNFYYTEGSNSLTAIDKSTICVAMYKNIAFRCVIYIMTPQLSTVKKYDLLLTLKDFSEESVGDIDPGSAGDITVTFSIVGENPKEEIEFEPLNVTKIEKVDVNGGNLTSIVSSGVNSAISVLS